MPCEKNGKKERERERERERGGQGKREIRHEITIDSSRDRSP